MAKETWWNRLARAGYEGKVRVSVRPTLAGIKLWVILIRSDDGKLRQVGLRAHREIAGASSGIRLDAPALIN